VCSVGAIITLASIATDRTLALLAASSELGKSYDEVTQMLEAAQNYTMIFK
jgi:hypothetical protein